MSLVFRHWSMIMYLKEFSYLISVAEKLNAQAAANGKKKANNQAKTHSSEDLADINLIPDNPALLSEYYNLLVRNVEFFYPPKSYCPSAELLQKYQLGVRCKRCKHAVYIPMDIKSIASSLQTIGSRHFCKLLLHLVSDIRRTNLFYFHSAKKVQRHRFF